MEKRWSVFNPFPLVSLTVIAPSHPVLLDSIPRSNLLSVAQLKLTLPSNPMQHTYIAATTADRRLHLIDPASPPDNTVQSYSSFQDSPILDVIALYDRYLLAASMSGSLLLYDTKTEQVLDQRKDHGKYVVKIATCSMGNFTIVATAGWDAKVFLYRLDANHDETPRLGKPIASMSLPSIPETLLFINHFDASRPLLLLTRRDSTFLHYYAMTSFESAQSELSFLGKQSLAPHSNAWVAFTPSDVQINPVDASIVAVATSSTPHMKLMVVRLLLPPQEALSIDQNATPDPGSVTQASQARADLLLQDKEEAAIMINISTLAPQTSYSTPRLVWRPDGSGIYVSSDDGIIRGFEAHTGKLVSTLEAHEPGSKIRCLCAGKIGPNNNGSQEEEEEILVTGGFDQKLVLWKST